jgi:hypothetical protein
MSTSPSHRGHGLVVADGRLVGGGPAAGRLDRGDHLAGGRVVAAVVDGHGGAVGGQAQGDGAADAPGPAGDQGDPAVQPAHAVLA